LVFEVTDKAESYPIQCCNITLEEGRGEGEKFG
jgi:hypothetical protein